MYENIVKYWPAQDGIFVLCNNANKLIKKWIVPRWLPAFSALYVEIKKNKIDHILVGHILPLGTVAYFISKIIRVKYSVFLHGMDFALALQKPCKRILTELILKNAEKIICGNSYVARLVEEFLGERFKNKIKVVNPGVEYNADSRQRIADGSESIKAKLILEGKRKDLITKYNLENKIILLTVGRLVKRKGADMVLKSLPAVLKKIPNLVYIIAGRGEELENYRHQIADNDLQNNVVIITNVDDEEKNVWYKLCDIFIMPARTIDNDFEGFGIVYLEANLFSKPVIAGLSGGVRDAVIDGYTGLLINPESINEIASSIVKLAKNKNLREKLGAQGKERAIKEFYWRKQVGLIYKILI